MKAIASTTPLFWLGAALTLLALFLQLIIPAAALALFLVGILGVVLSVLQKIASDREQKQQLDQERKRTEEVAQIAAMNAALHADRIRIDSNVNQKHGAR